GRTWGVGAGGRPRGRARVALPRGETIVSAARGGGSKDTWVLAADHAASGPAASPVRAQAQASLEEGIEDPTDDSYDEFEDPREEHGAERADEPDPVTSAIPLIDVEEAPHDAQ